MKTRHPASVCLALIVSSGVLTVIVFAGASSSVPLAPEDLYTEKAGQAYRAFEPVIVASGTDELQRRSEGSAVTLKNGNVLIAWTDMAGASDNARGYISGQEFTAEAKPIGQPRVLVPTPEGGINTLSPAIRRLKDGRLGMAFSYRMSLQNASRHFVVSADEGKTWSTPVSASDGSDPYMTGCNDRLTVLESGRLLAPLHCTADWLNHHRHLKVARSDDGGRTWATTKQKLELPLVRWPDDKPHYQSGCMEAGIAQRADGSLLMTMRTAMGTQFFSESNDQGESWTAPRSLEVPSPLAPANLSRIPGTNDLLLVWTPNYQAFDRLAGERHTIMTCVSKDGGRSWPLANRKILIHDPTRNVDYPSVLHRDGEVWITLRMSSGKGILEGKTDTGLVRVPTRWFYR